MKDVIITVINNVTMLGIVAILSATLVILAQIC